MITQTATLIIVALVSVVTLVCFLIVGELIKQVAQIRFRLNLEDKYIPVHLGEHAGASVDMLGPIGAAFQTGRDGVVVFFTTDCIVCSQVAGDRRSLWRLEPVENCSRSELA